MHPPLHESLLWVLILVPVLSAALLGVMPADRPGPARGLALASSLVTLALALLAWARFEPTLGVEFQLTSRLSWLDLASFHVGLDGLSLALVVVTAVLVPLAVVAAWGSVTEQVKGFHVALLLLQGGVLGALCALDLLLFVVCFEFVLVPAVLLVGMWGNSAERRRAAMKFFMMTVAGSALMLVAMLVLVVGLGTEARTFDLVRLQEVLSAAASEVAAYRAVDPDGVGVGLSAPALVVHRLGPWLFLSFALAFWMKAGLFPFHTWVGDTYAAAPPAASVVVAGILSKLGIYGLWRIALPFFPLEARAWMPVLTALAVVSVVYGTLSCLGHRDLRRLVGAVSVAHVGLMALGLVAVTGEGASGAAFQMVSHAVSVGGIFFLLAALGPQRNTWLLGDLGGVARRAPRLAVASVVVSLSLIALPGTSGFVGEFLVLLGTFRSPDVPLALSVAAVTGGVLAAAGMLRMIQRVFLGPVTQPWTLELVDLGGRQMIGAVPVVAAILALGFMPQPVLDRLEGPASRLVSRIRSGESTGTPPDLTAEVVPGAVQRPAQGR